jgi:hypothetical protein
MTAIIAQGGGFYGVAFFTTELTKQQIHTKLNGHNGIDRLCDRGCEVGDNNFVLWVDFDGQPQPKPALLFCSGHSGADLKALETIKTILDT